MNPIIGQMTNLLMHNGHKQRALSQVMRALDYIKKSTNDDPLKVLHEAIVNVSPVVALTKRRTRHHIQYMPKTLSEKQSRRKAVMWISSEASKRKNANFSDRLGREILAAYDKTSAAVKKKEELHKEVVANRAELSMMVRKAQRQIN